MESKLTIIYFICIFQILLLNNFISSKIIELKFKKKELGSNLSDNQIIKFLSRNSLLCEIKIGTPPQKIYISPKTDRIFSSILEDSTNTTNIPSDLVQFNSTKSLSYNLIKPIHSFSWIYGPSSFITETIEISQTEIADLSLIHTFSYESMEPISTESGILGLGILNKYDEDLFETNFIKNLKTKGIINSYNFFIKYDNDKEGRIVIGAEPFDYNSKEFPNKVNALVRLPSSDSLFWGFDVDKITYNNIEIKGLVSYSAKLKLEYGFIGVGPNVKEILDRDLFTDLLNRGICKVIESPAFKYYVCERGNVDKSKLYNLWLYNRVLDMSFTIPFKDLFLDYEDKSYFLVEFIEFISQGTIYLGEPFIKKNLITFNQDSKTLGLFNENISKPIDNNKIPLNLIVVFILIAVFSVLIIAGLSYYLCKKYYVRRNTLKKYSGIEMADENPYKKIGASPI